MVRSILSVLMIFAFVSAMVSPACAFMQGQNVAEICSVAGLNADAGADDASLPAPVKAQQDCGFCFAQSHLKPFLISPMAVAQPVPASYMIVSAGVVMPRGSDVRSFDARGPPANPSL